jgi:hypothetical protein
MLLVLSLPASHTMTDRRRWRSQRTQREFALWAERLRGLGLTIDASTLDAQLWSQAQRYAAVRARLAWGFEHYDRLGGMSQGWGMFRSPQRRPGRLRLEVWRDGAFQTVYLSRSDRYVYLRSQLDHNRIRKLVGRAARDAGVFNDLADWLGGTMARDFPNPSHARITLERFNSLPAERRAAGDVVEVYVARRRKLELGRRR